MSMVVEIINQVDKLFNNSIFRIYTFRIIKLAICGKCPG